MESDAYLTINEPSTGEFKDRGSKFIAYLYSVQSVEEAFQYLEALRKEHPKSRHICYAYRLGENADIFRMNDDSEPSSTAGRPIFGQLVSANITYVLLAVVRYFGGTKLGTSGLINAYKSASESAIQKANIIKEYSCRDFIFEFDYEIMGSVMECIKKLDIELIEKSFHENATLKVKIKKSIAKREITKLKAKLLSKPLESICFDTIIKGFQATEKN